jgi:alkanesulfonate monooxygenase SsuD/methylene tetrahydromethanopterin reductase-like flavin-dependent oxidoreductase (luciferase family)
LPRPQPAGGPPIVVGGNGEKRTLPLAARYADVWNGTFMLPDQFRERSAKLDSLILAAGRQPGEVRRTMMTGLFFGRTMDDLERRQQERPAGDELAGKPIAEVVARLRDQTPVVAGTAEDIVPKIKAYEAAGVEELMLQWSDFDDIDGLHAFADAVLPD